MKNNSEHYRISHVKPNTFDVEFYDTLTKKAVSCLLSIYVVEDRAPRVYPWVNERDGGILYA